MKKYPRGKKRPVLSWMNRYGSSSLFNQRATDNEFCVSRHGKYHDGIPALQNDEQNLVPHFPITEWFVKPLNTKSSYSMYSNSLPTGPCDFSQIGLSPHDAYHDNQGAVDFGSLDFPESKPRNRPNWHIEGPPQENPHTLKSSRDCRVNSYSQAGKFIAYDLSPDELGEAFEKSSLQDFAVEKDKIHIPAQNCQEGFYNQVEVDNGYNSNHGCTTPQRAQMKNNESLQKKCPVSSDANDQFLMNCEDGRLGASSLSNIDPLIYAECLERATEVVESGSTNLRNRFSGKSEVITCNRHSCLNSGGEMTHAVAAAVATVAARRSYSAASSHISSHSNRPNASESQRFPCDRPLPFVQSGWDPALRGTDYNNYKSGKRNGDIFQNNKAAPHLESSLSKFSATVIEEVETKGPIISFIDIDIIVIGFV